MSSFSVTRLAVFAVLSIAICGSTADCAEPEVIARLTYEIVPTGDPTDAPADHMPSLLRVVGSRIEGLGHVRKLTDEEFAVDVFSQGDRDDVSIYVVRQLVDATGVLQFRILASRTFQKHQAIIELALALADDADVVELDDKPMAQWIAVDEHEFPDIEQLELRGLVARDVGGRVQALMLVNDELNVTGDYLASVSADVDETGRPQVSFTFNDEGAFLFGRLTGQHVPTATGQRYSLGMVLDNRLLSAPTIESKITNRGRISGNMTEADVEYLVAVLSAGRMPVEVREVGAAATPAGLQEDP